MRTGGASNHRGASRVPEVSVGERRRSAPTTRASWAAKAPFDPPAGTSPDLVVREAELRRSRWVSPLLRRVVLTDVVVAAGVMAAFVFSLPDTRALTLPVAVAAGLVWAGVLALHGGYDRRRLGEGPEEFQAVLRTAVLVVAGLSLLSYAFQLVVPRRDVLIAVPLIAVVTVLSHHCWRVRLRRRRSRGEAVLRTLVVGEASAVADVVADLRRQSRHGLLAVGVCLPSAGSASADVAGVEVLGVVSEVPQVVVDHDIDNVLVVGSQLTGHPLRRLSWALEDTGADLMVAPGLVEVTGAFVSLHPAAGLSLLRVERPTQSSGRLLAKAVQDRTIGLLLLCAAAPVIAVAAVAVRLTSPGPAFFPQERVGQDGRGFTMWKLRSMVQDADGRLAALAAHSDADGLLFKMREDPRVTSVGRWLRRFSIDELPQLWNVLRGDMSLVGPRPPLPGEYARYHDATHRRLRVKPGLTGLWQVSGRSDLPWEEAVRLDLRYVDNWSPTMDLQILARTLRAVLTGSGAY